MVAVLARLRRICLALPNAHETVTFGHPTFRVNERMFAVLEEYRGELTMAFQAGKSMQRIFLEDRRFIRTPYLGQHGWVSLRLPPSSKPNWDEIAEFIRGSHTMVSAKKR
jgi:predicted DNA-binding protein (MmcQ/YjbR family)